MIWLDEAKKGYDWLRTRPAFTKRIWMLYSIALFCCFGRLFADYYNKEYVIFFQVPLWITSTLGHFCSVYCILRLLRCDLLNSIPRLLNRPQHSVGRLLGVVLIFALSLVTYTVFHRYNTVLDEFGKNLSFSTGWLLWFAGVGNQLFVFIEGIFLIYLLIDGVSDNYEGNNEKIVRLKNLLICLAGVNILFLGYDISWIILTIEHFRIKHIWLFEDGFQITLIGTLTFDILALISIYDIYTHVKLNIERRSDENEPTSNLSESESHNLSSWINCVRISSFVLFLFAVLRTLVNLESVKPYTHEGTDVIVAVILWMAGSIAMVSKIVLLLKYLLWPFYNSLHQSVPSNIPTVLFFLVSILITTPINFEQVFEAYEVWLVNCTAINKGLLVPVLGVNHACYAMLITIEGLIMIWLSNYKEYYRIKHKDKVIDVLDVAVTSSQWYCAYSVLFAVNLPHETTMTTLGRLCGPPLFHFIMSINYNKHKIMCCQIAQTDEYPLWSSITEWFINIKKINPFVGLLVSGVLRLLLPANRPFFTFPVNVVYLVICVYWIYVLWRGLRLEIIQTCYKKMNYQYFYQFPLEVAMCTIMFSILLLILLGIINRAFISYNEWYQTNELWIFINRVVISILTVIHIIAAVVQGLVLFIASISPDIVKRIEDRNGTSFVAHLKQLVNINVPLFVDNLIFMITVIDLKSAAGGTLTCQILLLYHFFSYILSYSMISKLKKTVAMENFDSEASHEQSIIPEADLLKLWLEEQSRLWKTIAKRADDLKDTTFQVAILLGLIRIGLKDSSVLATVAFRAISVITLLLINIHIYYYLTRHLLEYCIWTRIKKKAFLFLLLGGLFGFLEICVTLKNQNTENPLENGMLFIAVFFNFIFVIHDVVLLLFLVNSDKENLQQQQVVKNTYDIAIKANVYYAMYGILSALYTFIMNYNQPDQPVKWELFVGQLACSSIVPMMIIPALIIIEQFLTEKAVMSKPSNEDNNNRPPSEMDNHEHND